MRYLLFGGETYYAKGGYNDFISTSDDLDDLITTARKATDATIDVFELLDWWHIFDTKINSIVAGTEGQAYGSEDLTMKDNVQIFDIDV